MVKLTKVVSGDVCEQINAYVGTNKVIVDDYEAMVNLILRMSKDGCCFTRDRDSVRDDRESLNYMYASDDDCDVVLTINELDKNNYSIIDDTDNDGIPDYLDPDN